MNNSADSLLTIALPEGYLPGSPAPGKEVFDYEVMVQQGGDLALMFNAGVLPQRPQAIVIHEGNLHLLAADEAEGDSALALIGWIRQPSLTILAKAASTEGLLVVELSTLGVHSAQTLYAPSPQEVSHVSF